eukprot:TRINITY_DN4588_c2_g1_i1.p1 TRINITY_DN4588_c2_g1~~TRINITY_DN4588_c2_g1_i1.p1  ORF type:complete len:813 (-),score=153.79 TRINITY_DN4588_c2_g1_i1:360-2681(-)
MKRLYVDATTQFHTSDIPTILSPSPSTPQHNTTFSTPTTPNPRSSHSPQASPEVKFKWKSFEKRHTREDDSELVSENDLAVSSKRTRAGSVSKESPFLGSPRGIARRTQGTLGEYRARNSGDSLSSVGSDAGEATMIMMTMSSPPSTPRDTTTTSGGWGGERGERGDSGTSTPTTPGTPNSYARRESMRQAFPHSDSIKEESNSSSEGESSSSSLLKSSNPGNSPLNTHNICRASSSSSSSSATQKSSVSSPSLSLAELTATSSSSTLSNVSPSRASSGNTPIITRRTSVNSTISTPAITPRSKKPLPAPPKSRTESSAPILIPQRSNSSAPIPHFVHTTTQEEETTTTTTMTLQHSNSQPNRKTFLSETEEAPRQRIRKEDVMVKKDKNRKVSTETLELTAIQKFMKEKQIHLKLPSIEVIISQEDHFIRIDGPSSNTSLWAPLYGHDLYGVSISNYPLVSTQKDGVLIIDKNTHQGDPICDQFCVDRFDNRIVFAVADGCNWGIKPKTAAFNASRSFIEHVRANQSKMTMVDNMGAVFLEGFHVAQQTILSAGTDPRYSDLGTTTMIAGGIFEMPQNRWCFVAAGVGDCKAYHFMLRGDIVKVEEITIDSNANVRQDARDPGGRLGPQLQGGHPDLRNFNCWFKPMQEGDFVLVCSDGVHDNLDPSTLGLEPQDLGIDTTLTWDELCEEAPEIVATKKTDFAYNKLLEFYKKAKKRGGAEVRMQDMTDVIVQFCKDSTRTSREFMEQILSLLNPRIIRNFLGSWIMLLVCV